LGVLYQSIQRMQIDRSEMKMYGKIAEWVYLFYPKDVGIISLFLYVWFYCYMDNHILHHAYSSFWIAWMQLQNGKLMMTKTMKRRIDCTTRHMVKRFATCNI
jgi:hypothetical protein